MQGSTRAPQSTLLPGNRNAARLRRNTLKTGNSGPSQSSLKTSAQTGGLVRPSQYLPYRGISQNKNTLTEAKVHPMKEESHGVTGQRPRMGTPEENQRSSTLT